MAFFCDTVYNKATKRHQLEFVNQQYDCLMSIQYDEETASYKLDVEESEAQRISQYWGGRDFGLTHWLAIAAKELPERDRNPKIS
jgi:hypothetical protein